MSRNLDGTLKKGTVLNPQGRPKGSKDKVNAEVRKMITKFIDDNVETIFSDIEQLTPKERVDVFLRLLEYTIPKLQRTILEKSNDQTVVITGIRVTD